MKFQMVTMGELLIDMLQTKKNTYEANPGGATPNAIVGMAKQGLSTAFMGMVGNDGFGRQLRQALSDAQVNTDGLLITDDAVTTLSIVHLDETGDRTFTFLRKPGADMLYSKEDVNYNILGSTKAFHFGSVSLSAGKAREATFACADYAKKHDMMISYDPNLREMLWENLDEAKEVITKGFSYADIVKISEEELEFVTGEKDYLSGAAALHAMGVKIVFVTLGSNGCFYSYKNYSGHIPGYSVPVVDTTGAGDAFTAGVLSYIIRLEKPDLDSFTQEDIANIIAYGNAVGALSVTKKGGMTSMPTRQETLAFLANNKK